MSAAAEGNGSVTLLSLQLRVQILHDTLEKELASHKRALTRVWEQQVVLREEMASFRQDVQGIRSERSEYTMTTAGILPSAPKPTQLDNVNQKTIDSNYVTQRQHEATIASLREELQKFCNDIERSCGVCGGGKIQEKARNIDRVYDQPDLSKPIAPGPFNSDAQKSPGISQRGTSANAPATEEITFFIELDKESGKPVGAAVDGKDGQSLRVEYIRAGLLQDWNNDHPDKIVRAGDRIVEVNGQAGHSKTIAEALTCRAKLVLKIARAGPQEMNQTMKNDNPVGATVPC